MSWKIIDNRLWPNNNNNNNNNKSTEWPSERVTDRPTNQPNKLNQTKPNPKQTIRYTLDRDKHPLVSLSLCLSASIYLSFLRTTNFISSFTFLFSRIYTNRSFYLYLYLSRCLNRDNNVKTKNWKVVVTRPVTQLILFHFLFCLFVHIIFDI